MLIPDFQTLMLPFLKLMADRQVHTINELYETLCLEFGLTQEDKEKLLPSGNQTIMRNRVGWTRTYLKKAGLISSPQRASFLITEEGLKLLSSNPAKINVAALKKLPAFQEWVSTYNTGLTPEDIEEIERIKKEVPEITPSELIESGFSQMNETLSFDILERMKSITDKQFERLVLKVLTAMGYGDFREDAAEHTGKSHDGGIDGLIREDKLGLDVIYVQAKKYADSVPIAHVRDFAGSLLSKKAKKGVLITLSTFPQSAYQYVNSIEHKIALINGKDLAKFMIGHNVGVSIKRIIEIKDLDDDFFEEL
jgi:restriction system protein